MQENMQFIANAINAHAKPNLHDWLAVLSKQIGSDGRLLQIYENTFVFIYKGIGDYGGKNNNTKVIFNLTTGQPATQADFKAFNDIISV